MGRGAFLDGSCRLFLGEQQPALSARLELEKPHMGKKVYTRRTRRGEPQVQSFVTSSFKDYKDVTIVASSTTLMAKMRDCRDGRVAE